MSMLQVFFPVNVELHATLCIFHRQDNSQINSFVGKARVMAFYLPLEGSWAHISYFLTSGYYKNNILYCLSELKTNLYLFSEEFSLVSV